MEKITPIVFYHAACSWPDTRYKRPAGQWQDIIKEQVQQWNQSGLTDIAEINVGINGTNEEYKEACSIFPIKSNCWYNGYDVAWEFPTINKMIKIIQNFTDDTSICYHHTKAVSWNTNPYHVAWRKAMQWYCIENWKVCIKALDQVETCGIFWYDKKNYPFHFSGNFFWARAGYLKTLSELIDNGDRMLAETWITSNNSTPSVIDFNPGTRTNETYAKRDFNNTTKFIRGQYPVTIGKFFTEK